MNDVNIGFGDPRKNAFFNLLMHIIRLTEQHYSLAEILKVLSGINLENVDPETGQMLVEYLKDVTRTTITNNTILLIAWIDAILKAYGIEYEIKYDEFPSDLTVRDAIIIVKPLMDDLMKLSKELGVLPLRFRKVTPKERFELTRKMFKGRSEIIKEKKDEEEL